MTFNADGHAANSLANQQQAIAGPLETSMRSQALTIGAGGRIRLDPGYWEPMIQIAPARDLDDELLTIAATLVGGSALAPLRFERFSEMQGWLTLHVPAPLVNRRNLAAVEIDLQGRLGGKQLTLGELRGLIEIRVVEGLFARLLHVVSVEQVRIRRQARLIHQAACLDGARGFMLDRYGQELCVPRLSDRLVAQSGEIVTQEAPESDADYRRRLKIYRPWFAPSRNSVLEALNGTTSAPGPLQQIGAPANFTLLEDDNPLYSGLRMVSVAATAAAAATQLTRFFAYLRASVLIDPAVSVPAARAIPRTARQQENALRTRLRNACSFTDAAKRAMAPHLALAFDRLIAFVRACGSNEQLTVHRAQDDGGGNRFELGLAAEIGQPSAAMLNAVRTVVGSASARAALALDQRTIADTLVGRDLSAASGEWLFTAAGFRTFEVKTGNRLVVSHLSMGGLVVDGPATATLADAANGLRYAASVASDSAGLGMALAHALRGGEAGWPPGSPPWTLLPMAQLAANLDTLQACDPALATVAGQQFTVTVAAADIARFVEATKRYPAGTVALLTLTPAFVTALKAGGAAAVAQWTLLAETLGVNGAAALALFGSTSGSSVMAVSSHGLPLIGSNIGARRSTGYYWDLMPASAGAQGQCSPSGTESALRTTVAGVYAIHCLASARIGATDPFEYRVDLPAGSSLDIGQYEMLMNILGRCYPVAIEVNSWNLRRSHVVLGTANPVPLTPHQSRSFRRWQDLRFAGVNLSPPVS